MRSLAAQLAYEDEQENIGRLTANDRTTCFTCQTWADPEHREAADHKRRIGVPEDWSYDEREGRYRSPSGLFDHLFSLDEARVLITRERGHAAWDLFLRWHDSWVQYQRHDVEAFLARDLSEFLTGAAR